MYKKNIFLIGFLLILFIVFFINIQGYFAATNFEGLYDNGELSDAEKFLQQEKKNDTILYNLGNTAYKKYFQDNQNDIAYLESALTYFSGSLAISEQEDAQFNYDVVKNILDTQKEQEQKQEEKNQEEQQQEKEKGEEESQSGENDSDTGTGSESQESQGNEQSGGVSQNARGEEYKLGENDTIETMTENEKAALERAVEEIKNEQMYNQQFFGKQEQVSDFQKAFDNLLGTGGEKDW